MSQNGSFGKKNLSFLIF